MKQVAAIGISLCCTMTTWAQVDGFNKGKGNTDLAASFSYQTGQGYWAGTTEIALKRDIIAASLYAAYGITDDLDVSLGIPFVSIGKTSALQDGQLYLKWLPLKKKMGSGKFTAGMAIGAGAPLTDYPTEGIDAVGQQATVFTPLGVVQYQFSNGLFVGAVGGYHIKMAPAPSAIPLTFRVGAAKEKLYWEVYAEHQSAVTGKDYQGTGDLAVLSTFREIGVSYTRTGGKVYKPFGSNFGLALDLSYVVAGRNADRAIGAALSAVYRVPRKSK